MVRVSSGKAKPVISFRASQEVVNASKSIPDFRHKLELYAEELYREWVAKRV
jgi:hypothetical protein